MVGMRGDDGRAAVEGVGCVRAWGTMWKSVDGGCGSRAMEDGTREASPSGRVYAAALKVVALAALGTSLLESVREALQEAIEWGSRDAAASDPSGGACEVTAEPRGVGVGARRFRVTAC